MATLKNRIATLEQQTPCEIFTAHQMATCTDDELLDVFLAHPYSDGSHEKFVLSLTETPVQRKGLSVVSYFNGLILTFGHGCYGK